MPIPMAVAWTDDDLHNEQALLGALMIDPDALPLIADLVAAEDIAHPAHRRIYEAMLSLRGVPVDYVLLCGELERAGPLSGKQEAYLVSLINQCPTSLHCEHYAQAVAAAGKARRQAAEPKPGTSTTGWLAH